MAKLLNGGIRDSLVSGKGKIALTYVRQSVYRGVQDAVVTSARPKCVSESHLPLGGGLPSVRSLAPSSEGPLP